MMSHIGLFGTAALAGMMAMGGLTLFLACCLAFKVAEAMLRLACMSAISLVRGLLTSSRLMAWRAKRMVNQRLLPALRQHRQRSLAKIQTSLTRAADKPAFTARVEPRVELTAQEMAPSSTPPRTEFKELQRALDVLGLSAVEKLTLMELKLSYVTLVKRFDPVKFPGDQVFLDQIKDAFEAVKAAKGWR